MAVAPGADDGLLVVELDVIGPQRRMQCQARDILVAFEMRGRGIVELQSRWPTWSNRKLSHHRLP
jgi:hypothetical protein